jgi:hypothetical protein
LVDARAVLLCGGIVATVVYAYLIIEECWKRELLLTPLTAFLFWYWLVLGVTAIYMAVRFPEYQTVQFLVWLVPMSKVATGYVLILLGACCLHSGVVYGLPSRMNTRDVGRLIEPTSLSLYIVLLCCITSVLYSRYSGSLLFLGSTVGYLMQDIGPAAACIYALGRRSGLLAEWDKMFALLPITALLMLAEGGHGSKAGFVSGSIPLLWFFLIDRGRRKFLLVFGPIAAAVYILCVTPAVSLARNNVGTPNVTAPDIIDAGRMQMIAFIRDPQTYLLRWSDEVAMRIFAGPVAVGYIASRVETSGYSYGNSFKYLIWASVPRIFWKDKPVVNRGQWFTSEIGASVTEGSATTSTGMTSPGELYWNFGWLGVIAGMWLIGYLTAKLLWGLALPDPRAGIVTMLPYVHALTNAMGYTDAEAGSSILNIIQAYLLFLFVGHLVRAVSFRKTAVHSASQYPWQPAISIRRPQ